jgi:hypothetical protein
MNKTTAADRRAYTLTRREATEGYFRLFPIPEVASSLYAPSPRTTGKKSKPRSPRGKYLSLDLPLHSQLRDLPPKKPILTSPVRAACDAAQNQTNRAAVVLINWHTDFASRGKVYFDSYSDTTTDMTGWRAFVDEFNAHEHTFTYYVCDPTFNDVQAAYDSYVTNWNALVAAGDRALTLLFGHAEQALKDLVSALAPVQQARTDFDTLPNGGGGIPAIDQTHRQFLDKERVATGFKLFNYKINSKTFDADSFYQRLRDTSGQERPLAAISELDRLREEYRSKPIPVPLPDAFTQSKHSRRFSFSQLNTGDYSWALLRDILLGKLDDLGDRMDGLHYKIQLNSIYRNPRKPQKPLSRHQYGDAADIQVFDFNGDGAVDAEDWESLRAVTDGLQPSYTEPMKDSGVGHVHVDWRGVPMLPSDTSDSGCGVRYETLSLPMPKKRGSRQG